MIIHATFYQHLAYTLLGLMAAIVGIHSLSPQLIRAQEVCFTRPIPNEVIQRQGFLPATSHEHNLNGPDLGFADVSMLFDCELISEDLLWEYKVECLSNAFGRTQDWLPLVVKRSDDMFSGTARILAGGWYRLEIRATADGSQLATGSVEPIGVGEVFLIAGQSYAAGENDVHLQISDSQSRIVRFDWRAHDWQVADDPFPHVGDGGTIWPAVGDLLLPILRVPIGFVNVAASGTSSQEWLPGNPLFERLAAAGDEINQFRFVLWQQGESDVLAGTSTEQYVENLVRIRRALSKRWDSEVTWLLAKSTLHPTVYDEPKQELAIRSAIDLLCQQAGFSPGPDTDILGGKNRGELNSRRHFTELGQKQAGLMWFASIWNELQKPDSER